MSLKRHFKFLTILYDVCTVVLSSIKPHTVETRNNGIIIYL